ncbi:MAG: DNA cytosine methyltransferase [Polyangiaceae bacterium]|nr:DNA cytosine methyltransferase [Polyangiaceae bacterium]
MAPRRPPKSDRRSSAGRGPSDVACVDLFCGAGGLTHGLIAAGVPVVAGVDLDETCRHPYEANNPGATFHARDVAKLKAAEVQSWFGSASVRVLAGCAPCQPFSSYAQRYETKGTERWGLLNHFARLVKQLEPDIVTMENVPTVTKHEVFADFVSTLTRRGYEVWYGVVDSAKYGLPQRRRRTVLLASRNGPMGLRQPDSSPPKTVRDVLDRLPPIGHGASHEADPLHTTSRLSPLNLKRIQASQPGGSWRDWPARLVAECHQRDTGQSYPGVYGRMTWDEPAPTLTTQFYGFGSGRFGHPDQDRALSLREGAILQGFPETYSFVPEGERVRFKVLGRLIGNAVPVELGRVIGESIWDHLDPAPQAKSTAHRGRNDRNGRPHSAVQA